MIGKLLIPLAYEEAITTESKEDEVVRPNYYI
jgi:hypothetical protein